MRVEDGLNEMGEETFFKKKAFFPQTPIFKEIAKRGFVFLLCSCSVLNDLVIKTKKDTRGVLARYILLT